MHSPYKNMLKEHKAAMAALDREIKSDENCDKIPILKAAIERTAANLRKHADHRDGDL